MSYPATVLPQWFTTSQSAAAALREHISEALSEEDWQRLGVYDDNAKKKYRVVRTYTGLPMGAQNGKTKDGTCGGVFAGTFACNVCGEGCKNVFRIFGVKRYALKFSC